MVSQGTESHEPDTFNFPKAFFQKHTSRPYLSGMDEYQKLYDESIRDPYTFWAQQARQLLTFEKDFHTIHTGSFIDGDNAWFLGGHLNASFNCVDRHAIKNPKKDKRIFNHVMIP
jgi:acetyl-CoA synthetase